MVSILSESAHSRNWDLLTLKKRWYSRMGTYIRVRQALGFPEKKSTTFERDIEVPLQTGTNRSIFCYS